MGVTKIPVMNALLMRTTLHSVDDGVMRDDKNIDVVVKIGEMHMSRPLADILSCV